MTLCGDQGVVVFKSSRIMRVIIISRRYRGLYHYYSLYLCCYSFKLRLRYDFVNDNCGSILIAIVVVVPVVFYPLHVKITTDKKQGASRDVPQK